MLKVKTKLGISAIAGIGLFADEFIPAGTIIWEYTAGMDKTFPDIYHEDPLERAFLEVYCYRYDGMYILCIDNGRFINHSDDPNTDDKNGRVTMARRDIQPGEEITSDYRDFGKTPEDLEFNMIKI